MYFGCCGFHVEYLLTILNSLPYNFIKMTHSIYSRYHNMSSRLAKQRSFKLYKRSLANYNQMILSYPYFTLNETQCDSINSFIYAYPSLFTAPSYITKVGIMKMERILCWKTIYIHTSQLGVWCTLYYSAPIHIQTKRSSRHHPIFKPDLAIFQDNVPFHLNPLFLPVIRIAPAFFTETQ